MSDEIQPKALFPRLTDKEIDQMVQKLARFSMECERGAVEEEKELLMKQENFGFGPLKIGDIVAATYGRVQAETGREWLGAVVGFTPFGSAEVAWEFGSTYIERQETLKKVG